MRTPKLELRTPDAALPPFPNSDASGSSVQSDPPDSARNASGSCAQCRAAESNTQHLRIQRQ
eukprot:9585951-Alexandrium_andersonii.AAC.1